MNTESEAKNEYAADMHPVVATEKLFGHGYIANTLASGEILPVGGSSEFSDETDIRVAIDGEELQSYFEAANKAADAIPQDKLADWLQKVGADISPRTFAQLNSITEQYWHDRTVTGTENSQRVEYYRQHIEPKLSEIISGGFAECAEIAALAQLYCQQAGIESKYVSGDHARTKTEEFSEPHSYLVITDQGREFIFDPTNPVRSNGQNLPSIFSIPEHGVDQLRGTKKTFLASTNLLSKKIEYFGVNDGTNIDLERQVVGET